MKMPETVDVAQAAFGLRVHEATIVRKAGLPYRRSITRVSLADLCRGIQATPEAVLAFVNRKDYALTSAELADTIKTTSRELRNVINLAGLRPAARFGKGYRYSQRALTGRSLKTKSPSKTFEKGGAP
jgi:hypothetical protein